MRVSEAGFILTSQELLFLAGLTGSEVFLGFTGENSISTTKEAEETWQRIEKELQMKNYIVYEPDCLKSFDTTLMDTINLCTSPAYFISCKICVNGSMSNCFFYIRNGKCVQLERDTSIGNSYILTPLRSMARLSMNLQDQMDYNEQFSYIECALTLTTEDLRTLVESDFPNLKKVSFVKGLDDDLITDLMEAFHDQSNSRTLILIGLAENNRLTSELLTFRGRKWLWRLSRTEIEDTLLCTAVSTEAYQKKIDELIQLIQAG